MTTYKKGYFIMSNNSTATTTTTATTTIEGVKGTVIVSRCKRKFIPIIDVPLNEGGYSDWRLLIPHGYITLSEAGKRYGCGLSFQALLKIMTNAEVPSHIMHIIKNDETIDPEDGTIKNFPIYRLLCLPQTPAYQYLERENGQGGGVLIPMADDNEGGEEKEKREEGEEKEEKRVEERLEEKETPESDPYYIFDGINPITVTLVNEFYARLAMQNFLDDVRERPFHPYDFTHPLFKDNGRNGLLYGFDVRKAWKQHKIDVVRRHVRG